MSLRDTVLRAIAASLAVIALAAPAAALANAVDLRYLPGVHTSSLAGTGSPSSPAPRPDGAVIRSTHGDDGSPWATVGLGLAATCLVVAGIAGAGAVRGHRSRVAV